MKRFILALIPIIMLAVLITNAQQLPVSKDTKPVSKKDNIRHLLQISGTGDYALIIIDDVLKNYKQMMTNVPPEYWAKSVKEIETSRFIDSVIFVYDTRFSNEEIVDLIKFFESPIGMKWTQYLGVMNEEIMQKATSYGNYIYNFINEKLIKDKYINQPEMEIIKKDDQNKKEEEVKPNPTEEQKSSPAKSTKKKK